VDGLKGRVFEVNMADLNNDEDQGFQKIRLCCEDVQGRQCLTDFHGMDMTRHHLCSLIRKWHSLIEAHADVKTQDGYSLRLFSIGFTERRKNQVKSTCYIRTSRAKLIRKKMVDIMTEEVSRCTLKELVKKFPLRMIEKSIETATRHIFPLQNIWIRKVKVLKKPKLDLTKLMELHGDITEDLGVSMIQENAAAQNLITASINAV
jgi:small subunit ribosomal protein S3Ae